MRRGAGLATVLRLAELRERQALGELARALNRTNEQRAKLETAEGRTNVAERESWLEPAQVASAGALAQANDRVGALRALASTIRPQVVVAQRELDRAREDATRERLRTRALEKVRDRREAAHRMEERRREARRVDELVRGVRTREGEDA